MSSDGDLCVLRHVFIDTLHPKLSPAISAVYFLDLPHDAFVRMPSPSW